MDRNTNDANKKIRLQKYISECGIMSRRAAEQAIRENRVLVNGAPASIGDKIDPISDVLSIDGKIILKKPDENKIYIMMYKPRGYVTTLSDEKGRKKVTDLLKIRERVYPVGRLDMDSEGLLLLTNDGELAFKLTHPRHSVPKTYHVTVKGDVSRETLNALNAPMTIDGYKLRPAVVDILKTANDRTLLRFTIWEGRNRQIRKMLGALNLDTLRLKRVAIGDLYIGKMRAGEYRYLTQSEVDYLKSL